jgi:hypothetical protein
MAEPIKYDCWSNNDENFHSDIELVVDQLNVGDIIYEGVMVPPDVSKWIDADSVIDDIKCQADDECGEYAEDFLSNVSNEAKQELGKLIADWVNKHDKPHFWSVENVRQRAVTEADYE